MGLASLSIGLCPVDLLTAMALARLVNRLGTGRVATTGMSSVDAGAAR